MAKTFERISLAMKFRVLFAAAVLAILTAALGVPWYFTERLVDEQAEQTAEQIASLALAEWTQRHPEAFASERYAASTAPATTQPAGSVGASSQRVPDTQPRPAPLATDIRSDLARYFTARGEGRRGPAFVSLLPSATTAPAMDSSSRRAAKAFRDEKDRVMFLLPRIDEQNERLLRAYRAVRADDTCRKCHDGKPTQSFQPDQLVGMIDLTMPPSSGSLLWWLRAMFLLGGVLAALMAFVVFYLITKRIILSPVRRLRDLADKVAEGDLTVRCEIRTGDEFERLGRRFNEMLDAIKTQQDQLRQANRALDLRLAELSEANVSLYEANRIKNEFLANVSHELRTPLTSIIGFAELLSEVDDEKRRRQASHILTSSRSLLTIINDLLDLARIEAGKAEVRLDKLSVTDLCQTLEQLIRPIADKNRLELVLKADPATPLIQSDAGKLQQVLYNLLSNALKFTPAGGKVTVACGPLPAGESPLQVDSVVVSVADTGPGIPAADQAHIFQKFARLDNPLTREHGGSGLGLAISKELMQLLGGRITLASEPGQGAVFRLVLPVQST